MTSGNARLSDLMQDRRLELGMKTWRALALEAGIAYETLRALRQGENVAPGTIHALERVLRWRHGSIDEILAGGEPAPADGPPPPAGERTAEEELDRIRERLRTPGGRAALRSAIAGLEAQLRVTEDPEERSTLRRLIHRLGGPLPHEPEPDVTKDDKDAG